MTICVWKRPELTEVFYTAFERYKVQFAENGFELLLYVCGSEDIHKEMAESRGHKYFHCENNPVSKKFQKLISSAMKDDWDYWLLMGSDDFLTEDGPEFISMQMNGGYDAGCPSHIGFFSLKRREGFVLRDCKRLGAARWYKREILDKVEDGIIYPGEQNKTLDKISQETIFKWSEVLPHKFNQRLYVYDIKSDTNIWSWHNIKKHRINSKEKWNGGMSHLVPELKFYDYG